MHNILVDLHRVGKNRFNGLYTYCYHLGVSLLKIPVTDMNLSFYIPKKEFGLFGNKVAYVNQRSIDKFFRFNTGKYDLWHATTTLSWYKPFNRKTKFVFTIHDLNFLLENPDDKKRNKKILENIQSRVDRAEHLVIISEFAYSQARQFLDLKNKPVSIIYPGCALLNEKILPVQPRYIPRKKFLFSIGLIIPRKNFHVLMPLLQDSDFELIIAGMEASHYKDKIINEAKKFDVLDKVKMIGSISEAEKVWYYQNCEAFMFPSFAEGFGSPIVEAMSFGKPVFLSKEASLPEIGGNEAYYFESFDPEVMKRNFEQGLNKYYKSQPQEIIKQRANYFSYDNAAKEHFILYEQMLL